MKLKVRCSAGHTSSREPRVRPHSSQVHDNCCCCDIFDMDEMFPCWLLLDCCCCCCWLCKLLLCRRSTDAADSCWRWVCKTFCLFSSLTPFFLLSGGERKKERKMVSHSRQNRRTYIECLPSEVRLFSRFPSGAILVGVTCLNLFIWITNLSLRAKAFEHTSQMYLKGDWMS